MAYGRKWKNKSATRLYYVWRSMRSRCYSPANASWKHYGGKGITVCQQWREDYDAFFDWAMANGYKDGLSIERKNNDFGYEPINCLWIPVNEQQGNTNQCVFIEHDGESKTISQWCRDKGLNANTVLKRRSAHNANTYEELFCNHLLAHRIKNRINSCLVCDRTESIKWRKNGRLCNTCYHRALRWSKKTGENIEKFDEFKSLHTNT